MGRFLAYSLCTSYEAKYFKMNKKNSSEIYFRFWKSYEVIMKQILRKSSALLCVTRMLMRQIVMLELQRHTWVRDPAGFMSEAHANSQALYRRLLYSSPMWRGNPHCSQQDGPRSPTSPSTPLPIFSLHRMVLGFWNSFGKKNS